jgi:hypothetical protein
VDFGTGLPGKVGGVLPGVRRIVGQVGAVKDAPDGWQHVLFSCSL